MNITIYPSKIFGEIYAPASKSSMQRACAAALVRKGISIIHNPGNANDDKAALKVIEQMGAKLRMEDEKIFIESTGIKPITNSINNGESGLGIRMFAPLIAVSSNEITINGEGSLLARPMDFFDKIFPPLGIEIKSNNGRLPIKIKGPLQPKNIEIDGSLSSQFLTGLLMAYSALRASGVTIEVNNLTSKPYIDLTLKVMQDFCLKVPENNNYERFYFSEKEEEHIIPETINYTVEGDWSGAAFLLTAGAVAGNITVKGLDINSTQADKKIIEALQSCGSNISINNEIKISRPETIRAFHFDATDCPDLFPPLAALAANADGITVLKGAKRLAHKESDRATAIQQELKKMNVAVEIDDDLMKIYGTKNIKGAVVHSHHDHRIAMMCAVVSLNADEPSTIEGAEAINKSYPDFFDHLKILGVNILSSNS